MFICLLQLKILDSPGEWIFFIADLLIIAFIVINIIDINRFVVRKTVLESDKIPEGKGVKFVFLTDLHSRKYAGNNEKLLEAIKACNPDFILCGGDMMTAKSGKNNETAVSFMNRLAADYKIFYAFHSVLLHFAILKKPDASCAETICITVPHRSSAAP